MENPKDKERIKEKIAKCMALSESGNEHEAAQALKHAKVLMEKHGISEREVQASKVIERKIRGGEELPSWKSSVGTLVSMSFDILGYSSPERYGQRNKPFIFVGDSRVVEAAEYAFEVLVRDIEKKSLEKYPKGEYPAKYRNAFIKGYINGVAEEVSRFAKPYTQNKQIMSFLAEQGTEIVSRSASYRMDSGQVDAFGQGSSAGESAALRSPVNGASQGRIGR